MADAVVYDDYNRCPRCSGSNHVKIEDSMEHHIHGASTVCKECGWKGYWAYGWYDKTEMEPQDEVHSGYIEHFGGSDGF